MQYYRTTLLGAKIFAECQNNTSEWAPLRGPGGTPSNATEPPGGIPDAFIFSMEQSLSMATHSPSPANLSDPQIASSGSSQSGQSDPFSNAHAINPPDEVGTPSEEEDRDPDGISPSSVPETPPSPPTRLSRDRYVPIQAGLRFGDAYRREDFDITELSSRDDIEIVKTWQRYMIQFQPVASILCLVAYAAYFTYRIIVNYRFMENNGKQNALWAFVVAEGICLWPLFFQTILLSCTMHRRKRPRLRLQGDIVPAVDVMLTTCGEPVDMILDTVRTACAMDYPVDRYRIIVCDDGADAELQAAVTNLALENSQLFYYARVKGEIHNYKAGNLQAGIEYACTLPGGPGQIIATLDADMIPESFWLRGLLPHLLRDDKMALCAPPQTFYNVPPTDPLCQSMNEFIHFVETKKDAMGVAWCTGSGVVFKRSVIDEIGGWPVASLAEDVLCSSMMHAKGYKTAYIHEWLQCGLIPDTIAGHLKQRTRWALGTVQTSAELNYGLWGDIVRHMSARQRFCTFIFGFENLMTIPVMCTYLIMPALLYWGRDLLVYSTSNELRWQLRLCAIWVWLYRLNELVVSLPSGYIHGQRMNMAYNWMSPYIAFTLMRCYILPTWLGGIKIAFTASGSLRNKLHERDEEKRAPVATRIKLIMMDCSAYCHILYIAYVLGAIGLDISRAVIRAQRAHDPIVALRHMLVHSALPPLWWLILVTSFLVPIFYAIWPPTVPPRDSLLERDPKTLVARPKIREVKQKWDVLSATREVEFGLILCYVTVLFVGTFIY